MQAHPMAIHFPQYGGGRVSVWLGNKRITVSKGQLTKGGANKDAFKAMTPKAQTAFAKEVGAWW